MANTPQARKRVRQAEKRRQNNASQRSCLRTHIKRVVCHIDAGDKTAANDALVQAVPIVDRAANNGLIHKNKAARHKSRLYKRIQALA